VKIRASAEEFKSQSGVTGLRRFFRVLLGRSLVAVGATIVLLCVLVALFASWMAPYDPNAQDLHNTLASPGGSHLLGTDGVGRDVLTRVIYGTRTSLLIGLAVVAMASVIGGALGLLAGYFGRWVNTTIMRIIDAVMSFPMILLALMIAALLGGGIRNIIIALTVGQIPAYARLMCGQVMSIRVSDYVLAVHSLGATDWRVMLRHVLPNSFPPLIVMMTMMLGAAILGEAGLSYLGVGISPPAAAWGSMINQGQGYLLSNPLLAFAPGLALMLVVFAFNVVGDGLRDALDPRLRGTL
jgi:peptide/nickel transport system permease protein